MSVLITGIAGFIGSHVADALIARGHEVVGIDDLSGGFRDNVPAPARFYMGSILDAPLLERIFAEHRPTCVFHLAAYAAEGLSHFIRHFNYTNNVLGSVNVINCSVRHNVKCVVFTSSIAVYGQAQVPMSESTVPQPEDPYGIAKYAVELDLRAARTMFGLNSIIFRPHNVFGERQNIGDRYRNVIGIFMNQLMRTEPMTIFGDGRQTRAFSYVGDVAPLLARSIEIPAAYNEVFNIGSDEPIALNNLAQLVAQAMGCKASVRHLEPRKEVVHAFADHSKLCNVFGHCERRTLADGLARMAEWAKKIGPRDPGRSPPLELDRNLPGVWRA